MGTVYEHSLGRQLQFYVSKESVLGTFNPPATGDSMRIIKVAMDPKVNRKNRRDSYMATRDTEERITGRSEHSWAVDAYYVPSGVKTTAPDCGPFLEALFGKELVGSNDVTYSQLSSQTLKSLSLTRRIEGKIMETMWGCVPESMTFKCSGSDEPKIHFEGRAKGYVQTGYSTLNGGMSATNQMHVQTADYNMFGVNSVVKIDADDGTSDEGYQITVDHATGSITAFANGGGGTVTATSGAHGLTNGQSVIISGTTNYNGTFVVSSVATNTFKFTDTWVADDGTGTWNRAFTIVAANDGGAASVSEIDTDTVVPWTPTFTDVGVPMTGISGSLTWDNLDISALVTGFEFTVKANNKYVDDSCFQQDMIDAIPGFFDITGKVDVRLRSDFVVKLLNRKDFGSLALAVVVGGAAQTGTRLEIAVGQLEQEYTPIDIPESEESVLSIPIYALGTATGNDSFTWKHT